MYYFIVNPSANRGHGEKVWRELERCLRNSEVEYEVWMTQSPGDAAGFARRLQKGNREPQAIVVVGGSGTLNETLNGLSLDEEVTLGYIPAGMGNDFARGLKLPRSPKRCLKRILNSRYYRCLDYGVLSYENGAPVHRRFAVSSGLGLDAAVYGNLPEGAGKRRLGLPCREGLVICCQDSDSFSGQHRSGDICCWMVRRRSSLIIFILYLPIFIPMRAADSVLHRRRMAATGCWSCAWCIIPRRPVCFRC